MWDLLRVICWLFSVALCWFAFQRAVTVGATVLTPARASASRTPPFGRRGILCRAGDLRVLRPTRRIHIRRRGRVLHNSPPPASVRSAAAPTVTAHGTSGRVRRVGSALGLATVPHGDAPAPFARHPRRDAASPEYRLLASLASVGAIREPHPRVSLRSALGHSPRFLTTC